MPEFEIDIQVPDYGSSTSITSVTEVAMEIEEKMDKALVDKVRRRVIRGQVDGK